MQCIEAEALMDRVFEAIFCIKTGFAKTPKKAVESIIRGWPTGTEFLLTCTSPTGKQLVFV
jgi:hypothetical protein